MNLKKKITKGKLVKTTIMLEETNHKFLRQEAFKRGISMGELIREQIDLFIKKYKTYLV